MQNDTKVPDIGKLILHPLIVSVVSGALQHREISKANPAATVSVSALQPEILGKKITQANPSVAFLALTGS